MKPDPFCRNLTLVLTVLLTSFTLHAASFVVPPDEALIRAADAIVLGTVESTQPQFDDRGEIVTLVSLRLDSVIKGDLSVMETVRVTVPGGVVGNQARRVSGMPAYWPNGRVLAFLKRNGAQLWVTYAEALGKFEAIRYEGVDLFVRGLPEEEIFGWDHRGNRHHERARMREEFLDFIRRTVEGETVEGEYLWPEMPSRVRPAQPSDGGEASGKSVRSGGDESPDSHFPPSAYLMGGTTKFRWDVFDRGGSVSYRISGSQPGYDSTGAAQRSVAAWTNDPGSNINAVIGGTTSAGFTQDGVNAIVFNSSTAVPAGAIGYSQIFSAGVHAYKGETFYTIAEGDVVMRSGLSVSATVFEEAVAHELGHSLGFRHSNEGTPSSSAAIMNSVVSGAYGSNLQAWDREAAGHVYTSSAAPCSPPTITTQPVSVTILPGSSTTLVVQATGATSYQWYIGASGNTSNPIAGATGTSLVVSPSTTTSYWVRAINSCGAVNSGTVTVTLAPPPGGGTRQKTPVDFNGDRISDIVVYRRGAWIFYPAASGIWTGQTSTSCIPAPADYDGDGRSDFSLFCAGAWHFYRSNGSYLKGIWTGGVAGDLPVPADYNGDGRDEVVIHRRGAWVGFDYNTGQQIWSVWTGPGTANAIPLPMDYNGDGRAEFTVYAGGAWNFYRQDGAYVKGIWTGGAAGDIPVPGDYDGNGTEDVVVFRGGAWRFYDFATGVQTRGVWTGAQSYDGAPLQPAPLDYDGDGSVDFTIYAGGPWHFYHDNGSYRNGVWIGRGTNDRALSRRQHLAP